MYRRRFDVGLHSDLVHGVVVFTQLAPRERTDHGADFTLGQARCIATDIVGSGRARRQAAAEIASEEAA